MNWQTATYLDIETTGLSASEHSITLIATYAVSSKRQGMLFVSDRQGAAEALRVILNAPEQLDCDELSIQPLPEFAAYADTLSGQDVVTYNGRDFDLPFIRTHLPDATDAIARWRHTDLLADVLRPARIAGKIIAPRLGLKAMRAWYQIDQPFNCKMVFNLVEDGVHALQAWNLWEQRHDTLQLSSMARYCLKDARSTRELALKLLAYLPHIMERT